MSSWANLKEKIKTTFKRTDYKVLYEEERKVAESWEFKYNKLYRQLSAIIKESKDG